MNTYNNDSTVSTPRNRSLENLSYAPWKPLEPAHELQAQVFDYYQAIGFSRGEKFWINTYDAGVYRGILGDKVLELWRCKKAEDGWSPAVQISDPIEYLRELGAAGHNIQSYPNHLQGGLSNHHASRFTTVWYEIDDLPLEAQRDKLRWIEETLGLKATITVFSGGKSLHVYFTFDRPVDADTWTRIIRKLAIVAGGDPAICTHARAMRLPGVPRLKNGEAREVAIESLTGTRHNPKDIEAALDSTGLFPYGLGYERWLKWRKNRDSSVLSIPESELVPKYVPAVRAVVTHGVAVPLEKLVTKDDRVFIDSGAGEGNRDNTAYKAARNLIATEIRAQELGIPVDGDSRQLFEAGCDRCTPTLASRDRERIWRSASRGNPSPTLSDEILLSCAAAHQHRENASILRTTLPGEISRTEWESRHALQQAQTKLANFLNRVAKQSRQWLASTVGVNASRPAEDKQVSGGLVPYGVIVSDAGERTYPCSPDTIPNDERMKWLGYPTLIYEADDRKQMWAKAYRSGGVTFDSSATGSGKSHTIGDLSLSPYPLSINKVFYLTNAPENPPTAKIEENYTRWETRHNGQSYDHSRHTEKGRPHVKRTKAGETPDIPGNCPDTATFHEMTKKGIIVRSGKDSVICQSCSLNDSCEYRTKRREQYARETLFRANTNQMPTSFPETDKAMGLWDEIERTFEVNVEIKFSFGEARQTATVIHSTAPELYSLYYPQLNALVEALSEAERDGKISQYGLSLAELQKLPAIQKLLAGPRFIVGEGVVYHAPDIAEYADKHINPRIDFSGTMSPEQKQQWVQENLNQRLSPVFKALWGTDKRISVNVDQQWTFAVSRPVSHHRKVAAAMDYSICLDATLSRSDLAARLGISKKRILEMRQKPESVPNLTINIVTGIGKCGQTRETEGDFAQHTRIKNFVSSRVEAEEGETKVIDSKKFASVEGWRQWFTDSRGSNEFKTCDQLILIGHPIINLNAAAAKYQAIWGGWQSVATKRNQRGCNIGIAVNPSDVFKAESKLDPDLSPEYLDSLRFFLGWIQRTERAEIVQGVGRLRAQHSNKPQTCWIVGDGHGEALERDLRKAYPGCTVNFVKAADICLAAARKGEQRHRAIVSALYQDIATGAKVTKAKLAEKVGLSVSRVKQLCSNMGGFNKLVQGLHFLLLALKGKLTPHELPADALWVAREYLPAIASQLESGDIGTDPIQELADIRKHFGHRNYLAILAAAPVSSVATIFKYIVRSLPPAILERIRPDEPRSA